jgi:hypothetical protein
MKGVETVIAAMSAGGRTHLTRFRPPFGEPYQASGPGLADVQAVVAKYAVYVGWNFLTHDADNDPGHDPQNYNNANTSYNIVVNGIGARPGAGKYWGLLLMHGVLPWTHDVIPRLFDPKTGYLATHGFKTATVEDVICWKYGMHSWDIVNKVNNYTGANARGPN